MTEKVEQEEEKKSLNKDMERQTGETLMMTLNNQNSSKK
jgi:hypothetical protein